MLLSVLLLWVELIMGTGLVDHQSVIESQGKVSAISKKERHRTQSEVRYIQMEFGAEYSARKLSKREKLSLVLTNAISDSQ
jgi:hypothetical protein